MGLTGYPQWRYFLILFLELVRISLFVAHKYCEATFLTSLQNVKTLYVYKLPSPLHLFKTLCLSVELSEEVRFFFKGLHRNQKQEAKTIKLPSVFMQPHEVLILLRILEYVLENREKSIRFCWIIKKGGIALFFQLRDSPTPILQLKLVLQWQIFNGSEVTL